MIHLTCDDLAVTYLPEKGMNFVSYRKGELEAIDPSTMPLFEERYAGLGAMIGPHFHHRQLVPKVPDETRFPHIAVVKAQGSKEPFSHGIGRYAPWTVEAESARKVVAVLRGDDIWEGVSLKELEGQDFTMHYTAELRPEGLAISLAVVSETESVVGLHTYYALGGEGRVRARVHEEYNDQGVLKPIPQEWMREGELDYAVDKPTDYGFRPAPDPLHGQITLETPSRRVRVDYHAENEENSWQLWHPKDASFVCMEPLSAKDPRKPKLSVSRLEILIHLTK